MKKLLFVLTLIAFNASASTVKDDVLAHLPAGKHEGKGCTVTVSAYDVFKDSIGVNIWKGSEFRKFEYYESFFNKVVTNASTSQVLDITIEHKPDDQYTGTYFYTVKMDEKRVTVGEKRKGLLGIGSGKNLTCDLL